VLPFAMIAAIIISNVGANMLHSKLLWFVLSYALASGGQLVSRRFRPMIVGAGLRPLRALVEGSQRKDAPLYFRPWCPRGSGPLITRVARPRIRTNE